MDIDKELRQHKFIIFGFDHYNTLGAVRSLGEKGILPIIVIWSNKPYLTTSSKYAKYTHLVDSVKSGYNLILTKYGNESKKPFLYSCDDFVESYLDEHQNEVKEKFFIDIVDIPYEEFIDGNLPSGIDAKQKKLEDWLYAHGVDHIIGGHPHVVQPVRTLPDYRGRPTRHLTVWSLGNYISNMSAPNTYRGLAVTLYLKKNILDTRMIRYDIHPNQTQRPQFIVVPE